MNKTAVAQELVKVAKELTASSSDLADAKDILDNAHKKLVEYERQKSEAERKLEALKKDALTETKELVNEILEEINKALMAYFKGTDAGLNYGQVFSDGEMSVTVGSKDGIKRDSSMVVVKLQLLPRGREVKTIRLLNEKYRSIDGKLSEHNTVASVVSFVDKAYRDGFWSE